jgi:hypothetical protein
MKKNRHTSICIFKCALNLSINSTKLNKAISNNSGIDDTPLRDNDTHKENLLMNEISVLMFGEFA